MPSSNTIEEQTGLANQPAMHKRFFSRQQPQDSQTKPYINDQISEDITLAVNLLKHGANPLLIQGETGSGKSTYLNLIKQALQHSNRCVHIQSSRKTTDKQLLRKVVRGLRIPRKITQTDSMVLFEGLINLSRKNISPVILIDDAHLLPEKTLDLLTDLVHDKSIPLTLGLFATPALRAVLSALRPALDSGTNTHLLTIRPLTIRQSTQFLQLHLQNAAIDIPVMLTDVQIAKLHKHSHGLPGRIKNCADDLFRPKSLIKHIQILLNNNANQCDPGIAGIPKNPRFFIPNIIIKVTSILLLLLLIALAYYFSQ